jgi:predicted peroxiredoxin
MMKVLYIATTGAGDPTRASIPYHLAANGSVDAGQDCAVVLVGDATELVARDTAAKIEGLGFKPAGELLQKLVDNQVPIHV